MSKGTAEAVKKEGGAPTGGEGHAKKTETTTPVGKGKGHNPGPDGCHAWGCKSGAKQFNFCDEHYDHFKFGLIKKTGEQVPDYEKKFGHYMAHKSKRGVHKVA
jgi:hypothetical protein